jgi:alpha-tubulin suppressor-like RCC1 family protein
VTASNSYGSTSATSAQTAVVVTVPAVSAGGDHTCALSSAGTVKCWGRNYNGQLGNGTTADSSTPVQVKDVAGTGTLSHVTQISAGGYHTCALLRDHTVECWGWNSGGQLGSGTTTQSSTPVQVKGVGGVGTLSNVSQVSAGYSHTCALSSAGTVECWGYNGDGELGNGTTTQSSTPVQVKDVAGTGTLSNVTQISAGRFHTCALQSDNTVVCWGYNGQGQLGNGATADSSTPVQVKDVAGTGTLSNVTEIEAGGLHTCALLSDHTVECWGWNSGGQLGNGATADSSIPVSVIGIP